MANEGVLRGRSIVVAGAGLAGLAAAADLHRHGARVLVLEARDRVGGRVWTLRDGFVAGQHAEAGGDLIEDEQEEVRRLATDLGLTLVPILHRGFAYFWRNSGSPQPVHQSQGRGVWATLSEQLEPWVRDYRLADQRWDSVITQTWRVCRSWNGSIR